MSDLQFRPAWVGTNAQFRAALSAVATQVLHPTTDASNTGWTASTGTDLAAMIGETVRNDATYISTDALGAIYECALTLGTDPVSSIGHIPSLVLSANTGGITIRLKQGATTVATWTYPTLPATPTLYTPTLTTGEIDSITDYSDLRISFETI